MDDAVGIALQRNRDVLAARLEIEATQLDVVAARVYPNPTLQYAIGNLVLGTANGQGAMPPVRSGFLGQPVQSVGIGDIIDVWAKRSARTSAAERGVEVRKLLTEDALREVVYAVRTAYGAVVRAQSERDLAREVAERHAETVRLSRARFKAGDISEAELRKIELESLRYQNDVIDTEMRVDLERTSLAALLGLSSAAELPPGPLAVPDARPAFQLEALTTTALDRRPDLRAARAAQALADARLGLARREAYPDISLGASYTHSSFAVSGDNPNTMGLNLSLPLPLFDRNQANIGRARVDIRRADNDVERLQLQIRRDVAEATRQGQRSQALLRVFEGPDETGAMIARAETALKVAEKSYRAGAISLLELLEAQRTYLDTQAQYLRALYDFRQATVDVSHAVGEP